MKTMNGKIITNITINNWPQKQTKQKQLEQEQNHRNGDHMEGYHQGKGEGTMGENKMLFLDGKNSNWVGDFIGHLINRLGFITRGTD